MLRNAVISTTFLFNGDGITDIAVANVSSNNVSVFIGNGSGGFGVATNIAVGSIPYLSVPFIELYPVLGKRQVLTGVEGKCV